MDGVDHMHPGMGTSGEGVRLRDFSQSLPMSLLKAREAVMRHFRASLRDHGITEQQWRVLRALASGGETEIAGLARATCLLGPSLSRILRDLDGRGLIARRSTERDLRRGFISISSLGSALIAQVSPRSEAIYGEIAHRFGADRLALLQELLRELETTMAEAAPEATPEEHD